MTGPFHIPASWQWVPFSDVAWVASNLVSPLDYPQFPHIAPNHIESGTGRLLPYATVAEDGVTSPKHLFKSGQIIYSKIRPYLAKAVHVNFEGLCSADMYPIETSINSRYLFWWLLSPAFTELAARHQGRVVLPKINREALDRLPIPVPPLAEQDRIVSTLEDYLLRLAKAESHRANAAKRAEGLQRSIFDEAIKGTLFAGPVEFQSDLIGLEGRSGRKIDYSVLPELPFGWRWRVAEEVCESVVCGGTPRADVMSSVGEIPFLKVYNLTREGALDFTVRPTFIDGLTHRSLLKRSQVRPGDVLTNIVGPPLGKTSVVPECYEEWNINQAIVAFRAGPDLSASWLALALQAPFILRLLSKTARATAGQSNIALSTCRELPIPVPPKSTQEEICGQVAELSSKLRAVRSDLVAKEAWAAHLRSQVLREAFSGRLVEQNPADESASALLANIRVVQGAVRRTRRGKSEMTLREGTLL